MDYSNKIIEGLLQKFKPVLGSDYDKYKNHVYRVFLNCILLDKTKDNEELYAFAALFHDIGIWTNNTIDYLQPSIAEACKYLAENGKKDIIADITLMIYWHHKITRYSNRQLSIVEVFRKADWIDVSLGLIVFGLDQKQIKANRKIFPNLGFHLFLIKQIIKNLFQHPLNPLPMFKK
ncbi:MAG: HD domain-containing protein [Rhizobacter sp.]|nr:HD domain-containing protein [Ferruginibacter sp.]